MGHGTENVPHVKTIMRNIQLLLPVKVDFEAGGPVFSFTNIYIVIFWDRRILL